LRICPKTAKSLILKVTEYKDFCHFLPYFFIIKRERSSSDSDLQKESITTPADIYDRFHNNSSSTHLSDSDDSKPLKSILKKDSRSGSTENLKLRPILKTSPEHRPGTPEFLLDEPHSILKTPPDTQASENRPGTPEHTLGTVSSPTPARHSILKSNTDKEEIYVIDDDSGELGLLRPILKSHDNNQPVSMVGGAGRPVHSTIEQLGSSSTEVNSRSILKKSSIDSPTKRPFSPEMSALSSTGTADSSSGSILKTDNSHTRNKAKSPDIISPVNASSGDLVEPKPILKNQQIASGEVGKNQVIQPETRNKVISRL